MKIHVIFSSQLAQKAGVPEQVLDLPEDASVKMAIQRLAAHHGEAFASLVGGSDLRDIRTTLLAAVDGEQVRDLDRAILKTGNELMLLMPMAGG